MDENQIFKIEKLKVYTNMAILNCPVCCCSLNLNYSILVKNNGLIEAYCPHTVFSKGEVTENKSFKPCTFKGTLKLTKGSRVSRGIE